MAYIRYHMSRDDYDQAGDPFSLRMPKRLRKMKLGKMARGLARFGAGFIPGIGNTVASMIPTGSGGPGHEDSSGVPPSLLATVMDYPQDYPQDYAPQYPPQVQQLVDWARSYGLDIGDPGKGGKGKPAGTRGSKTRSGTPKRRGTSTKPPSQKLHSTRGTTSARPHPPSGGPMMGGALADRLGGVLAQARSGNLAGMLGTGLLGTGAKLPGFGRGHRQSMNMTNVKALKRGLRRIEGFEKIVKRVQKAYPRLKHATHSSGHKAGCACVTCKRK